MLIKNGLQEKLFAQIVDMLREKGLILKKGTIVDSTIILAPLSTKNADRKRDPEAHSTKKGNQWYFDFKAHIGVDKETGLVHTVKSTAANVHDVAMTSQLLHGEEKEVYGDSGYLGADKREDAILTNKNDEEIEYEINLKPSQIKKLPIGRMWIAMCTAKRRAKVEHVFAVVKRQLRYRRTRYRGLEKLTSKINIMFALTNLILADSPRLMA